MTAIQSAPAETQSEGDPTCWGTLNPRGEGRSLRWDGISSELTRRRSAAPAVDRDARRTWQVVLRRKWREPAADMWDLSRQAVWSRLSFHIWSAAQSLVLSLRTPGCARPASFTPSPPFCQCSMWCVRVCARVRVRACVWAHLYSLGADFSRGILIFLNYFIIPFEMKYNILFQLK